MEVVVRKIQTVKILLSSSLSLSLSHTHSVKCVWLLDCWLLWIEKVLKIVRLRLNRTDTISHSFWWRVNGGQYWSFVAIVCQLKTSHQKNRLHTRNEK